MHLYQNDCNTLKAGTLPKPTLEENMKDKDKTSSVFTKASFGNDPSSSRRVSKEGISIIKGLWETEIFRDWVEALCTEDPRYPIVELFQSVATGDGSNSYSLDDSVDSKASQKQIFLNWASSFRRSDPRFQILKFFNNLAHLGSDKMCQMDGKCGELPNSKCPFDRASIFSVWRPTSIQAIKKMMLGEAVGKGLDIKGKSAKKGKLSGFVPFLQIHKEKHKRTIRSLPRDSKIRIFYSTKETRDEAAHSLMSLAEHMMDEVQRARTVLENECSDKARLATALQQMQWDMADPNIDFIDDYAPTCFGMDVPERLLWEGYVMRQDCHREPDSTYDAGRLSEPAFQDMNFAALRHATKDYPSRKAVIWQYAADPQHAMCPQNLLMAYEENGRVMPVVSDFDCFLIGTRRMSFGCGMPLEQVELMKWSVSQIEKILDGPPTSDTWTVQWLEVLKEQAEQGFHPEIPTYGFGDPSSYSIMGNAVKTLERDGCVRHGAECFNYYFPQELDDQYLVISNTPEIEGNLRWKYVNPSELQDILCRKIDKGFTFPLNLKWVLCDPGWKRVYDRLMASQKLYVQKSLDIWFPPDSGVREMVEKIHTRYPMGFQQHQHTRRPSKEQWIKHRYSPLRQSLRAGLTMSGTTAMDLAKLELKHHVSLKRAKCKLPAAISFTRGTSKSFAKPAAMRRSQTAPVASKCGKVPRPKEAAKTGTDPTKTKTPCFVA